MNDEQLREQFTQWASPLRMTPPPAISVIQRRARGRTVRIAGAAGSAMVTAALACLVIVGIVTAIAHNQRAAQISIGPDRQLPPGGSSPHLRGGQTAAPQHGTFPRSKLPAPYMVIGGSSGGATVAVINMTTGRVLKRVRPTATRATFTAMAADQNDRLFVLAQQDDHFTTSFAEIRVSSGPTPHVQYGSLMPGVSLPRGYQVYGLTVNPAGTRLAFNTVDADGIGPTQLYVYDLTTGARLSNFSEGAGSVSLQYWPSPSELAFSWQANSGGSGSGSGLRILNVASASPAGASLLRASTLDSAVHDNSQWEFTADGSVALNVVQKGKTMLLEEYATGTGQLLHSVAIGPASAQQSADYLGVLWASANGSQILTQCGPEQLLVTNGAPARVSLGQTFRASMVGWADSLAW